MSHLPKPSALIENFISSGTGITNSTTMRLLSNDFTLGDNDVICGRGTTCFNHIGNERFREIIKYKLDRYLKAIAKNDKTRLIYEVVSEVRANSPNGGFVKLDKSTGQHYEVGDFLAREKTSQGFRDALHEHYKSSNMKKKIKRKVMKSAKTNNYNDINKASSSIIITSCSSSDTKMFSIDAHTVSPASSAKSIISASISTGKSMLSSKCSIIFPKINVTELTPNDFFARGKNDQFMLMNDGSPATSIAEVSETSKSTAVKNEQIKSKYICCNHGDILENTGDRSLSIPSTLISFDDDFDETFRPYDYNKWISTTSPDDFGILTDMNYCNDDLLHENFYDNNIFEGSLNDLFELSDDILNIQEKLRENMMLQSTLQELFP